MKHEYAEFREKVKAELKKRLAVWELSEEDLEKYVQQEEEEIKGAYRGYLNPKENDTREDDIRFDTGVSTVAMCLEYCY